ncbi:MAG TPA: Uma2 family endonuclease [Bryobacterales bacterium]|nr:Uma2 family endonuclease [Bryobacterales bacterium]
MASFPKPLDYSAYLKTPEIKRRYDIVDGEFRFMSPAPTTLHQLVLQEIFVAVDRHVKRYSLGQAFCAPCDVIISRSPLRTRQPDVMFISNARRPIIQDQVQGGPDLIVEVLSPGNTEKHVQGKLRDYAAADVREAWVVDPKQKTIAVLHAEKGAFRETARFRTPQRLRSKVLPRLRLPVAKVFPG